MESIIVIVGFLGVGKTTLLKEMVSQLLIENWKPYIILNDYENAVIDSQAFLESLPAEQVNPLSGNCICCSGINELRDQVNRIPSRMNGITLIEANGTTDAIRLMGFLGVGVDSRFSPPIQVAVIDVRNWQRRAEHNELEYNQVLVSSLIILNYTNVVDIERVVEVEQDLRMANKRAQIIHWNNFNILDYSLEVSEIVSSKNINHHKYHWSSCSVDLPERVTQQQLDKIISKIPSDILRVKGCVKLDDDICFSHFERTPTQEIYTRKFNGEPSTGPKLLTIGPGSDPLFIKNLIEESLEN